MVGLKDEDTCPRHAAFEPYTPQVGYIPVVFSQMSDERIMQFRSGFLKIALFEPCRKRMPE
jgi:hypothetical protein